MIKVVYIYDQFIRKNEEEIIEGADLVISYMYIEKENFLNISEIDINNSLDTSKLEELKKKYNNIVIFSSNVLSRFNNEVINKILKACKTFGITVVILEQKKLDNKYIDNIIDWTEEIEWKKLI